MSDSIPFEPYPCSLGTVREHGVGTYIIDTPDGRTIGIFANGEPSAANVEHDIANQPEPKITNEEIEALADIRLDGWAREWGYANAARATTYAGDPDPQFNAEGVSMRNARSALWRGLANAAQAPGYVLPTRAEAEAFIATFKPARPVAPFV